LTDAPKPYHPLSLSWQTINVENQRTAPRSHFKIVEQLVELRQNEPFDAGHSVEICAKKYLDALRVKVRREKTVGVRFCDIYAVLCAMESSTSSVK
jgi:hypothetical protein